MSRKPTLCPGKALTVPSWCSKGNRRSLLRGLCCWPAHGTSSGRIQSELLIGLDFGLYLVWLRRHESQIGKRQQLLLMCECFYTCFDLWKLNFLILLRFFSEVTFPLSRAVHFFRTDFVFTLQCFIFDWQVEKWGKSRVVSWKTTITVDDFYSSWPERVERTDAHCSWVTSTARPIFAETTPNKEDWFLGYLPLARVVSFSGNDVPMTCGKNIKLPCLFFLKHYLLLW